MYLYIIKVFIKFRENLKDSLEIFHEKRNKKNQQTKDHALRSCLLVFLPDITLNTNKLSHFER